MAPDVDASNDGNVNRVSSNHLGTSIVEFRSNCTVRYATKGSGRILLISHPSLAVVAADLATFEPEISGKLSESLIVGTLPECSTSRPHRLLEKDGEKKIRAIFHMEEKGKVRERNTGLAEKSSGTIKGTAELLGWSDVTSSEEKRIEEFGGERR